MINPRISATLTRGWNDYSFVFDDLPIICTDFIKECIGEMPKRIRVDVFDVKVKDAIPIAFGRPRANHASYTTSTPMAYKIDTTPLKEGYMYSTTRRELRLKLPELLRLPVGRTKKFWLRIQGA